MTSSSTPIIRPEQAGDEAAIRAVVSAAFPSPLEATLVDGLREAGRLTISLVAEVNGDIVGHVAFSPIRVGEREIGLGLAPLAVASAHRRQGIGAALVFEGLRVAKESGVAAVVLLGSPAYYSRFGFAAASRWRLRDEYGGGDAFQAIVWRPAVLPVEGGLVTYAPEFAIFAPAEE